MTPTSAIEACPARGLMMGNRGGRLHDAERRLGARRWASRAWLVCRLSFRGRCRAVWGASYTELFFLDEAVALAAGHRPCFECRRASALAFRDALGAASAGAIDAALHPARVGRDRRQVTHRAALEALPDGAFVEAGGPALVWGDALLPWRHEGYGAPARRPSGEAMVLTPAPTVAALAAGYRPGVHPSAGGEPQAAPPGRSAVGHS